MSLIYKLLDPLSLEKNRNPADQLVLTGAVQPIFLKQLMDELPTVIYGGPINMLKQFYQENGVSLFFFKH
jgi:hypothetical protein